MIYLSTGGHNSLSGYQTAKLFVENGIDHIELSGGEPDEGIIDKILTLNGCCELQIHNYFPPPRDPFVFNLATNNETVAEKSFKHALTAIDFASKLGCTYYSFHAGFLLDPNINELGCKIRTQNLQERSGAKALFVERVNEVSSYARQKGVRILLENNVISEINLREFGTNPFLMTDHLETIEMMNATDNNVGLLVDVAHLKVSSQSEGFCKNEYLESTADFTFAYHFSDNDGKFDSNEPISADSWFWPYVRKDLNYYTLEVYNQDLKLLKEQVQLARIMLSD